MNAAGVAKWVGLALVGLAIAVAVAILAAGLFSRQIGIAAEPLRAGEALAPQLRTAGEEVAEEPQRTEPTDEATTPEETTKTEPPPPEPEPIEPERTDDHGEPDDD